MYCHHCLNILVNLIWTTFFFRNIWCHPFCFVDVIVIGLFSFCLFLVCLFVSFIYLIFCLLLLNFFIILWKVNTNDQETTMKSSTGYCLLKETKVDVYFRNSPLYQAHHICIFTQNHYLRYCIVNKIGGKVRGNANNRDAKPRWRNNRSLKRTSKVCVFRGSTSSY